MSTELQKKLASEIAQNIIRTIPKSKKALVASSGYSQVSAINHATEIIAQKGVQKELKELGFTVENAKRIIGSILNAPTVYEMVTPENQIRAAQEVFKVIGEYDAEKHELTIPRPLLGGESYASNHRNPKAPKAD